MFQIFSKPLESINLREGLASNEVGAFVCFEGLVRNHNEGKKVIALEYEAFSALCDKEAAKIMQEAYEKFNIFNAKCFHRVGKLDIKEMAVWVGVTSAHRDAAFEACRYIIDEIKFRIPIWKKEYYENGDSGWVNCEECSKAHHH
ncbi:Molybdopterin synthase catalytic subunit MoaE [hydrothermal vent metagenome]|uniref:Molybdopterin synthase catalytic subunit MoaE n=1 Tax=hydrothermal vent metagenome TaxID=652676 RepID=A0A3B1CZD8_9ZZZZ